MKLTPALALCLTLLTIGCDKSKSKAPDKAPPAAAADKAGADKAATPPAPVAAPPAEVPADGFKFPAEAHAVGDKRVEVTTREMVMDIEPAPGTVLKMNGTETKTETTEVMAVDGAIVSKLKISYSGMKNTETLDGKSRDKAMPLDGKTYLVWREGDALKVSYGDGSAAPDDEAKEVMKDNRSVGRPEPMEEFIASVTWKPGVKVELNAEQLARMNEDMGDGDEDSPTLRAMSFTLQSADDATATLAMTMAMEMKRGSDAVNFELAGPAKVDRKTGRLLAITGTGPFSGVMQVKMSGTMTMKSTFTY